MIVIGFRGLELFFKVIFCMQEISLKVRVGRYIETTKVKYKVHRHINDKLTVVVVSANP